MIAINEAIPLIYINKQNGQYHYYINQYFLKKLRAGDSDLAVTLTIIAIGAAWLLIAQSIGVEAGFGMVANWNAPTLNPKGPPPQGPLISRSTPYPRLTESTALQAYAPSHTQASTLINSDRSVNLDMGYKEVLRRARLSSDFRCSFDRFVKLATECGEVTTDSMREAISALQLEADGVVSNVRRDPIAEANNIKTFDFLADGPDGQTHLEIKGPVGSEIRKAAGLRPSVAKQGKKIGSKINSQLKYWFETRTDKSGITEPASRDKVLVVNDLFDVPVVEKAQMQSAIESGLKGKHQVIYINNIINR